MIAQVFTPLGTIFTNIGVGKIYMERFVNLVMFVVVKYSLRTAWGSKISSCAADSGLDWGLDSDSAAPGHCSFKAIPVWLWLYMLWLVWWKNKSSRSLKQILQDLFIFYRIPFTLYPHKPAVDKHPHQTSWWGRCVTSRPYSCGWLN